MTTSKHSPNPLQPVLLRDNDQSGERHVNSVAAKLHGKAATIKAPVLPGLPQKGDVSDWLAGHTVDELLALVEGCEPWKLGDGENKRS